MVVAVAELVILSVADVVIDVVDGSVTVEVMLVTVILVVAGAESVVLEAILVLSIAASLEIGASVVEVIV